MADKIIENYEIRKGEENLSPNTLDVRESAKSANREIGQTKEGQDFLSSNLGEKVLDLYERNQELEKENVRDSLTGAYNRRYFDRELNLRLAKGQNIALGILDMDLFKKLNDTHGHKVGDGVLIEVVRRLSDRLRLTRVNGEKDFIARIGGDEFAVVLAEVDSKETAYKILEKLRKSVEETKFRIKEDKLIDQSITVGASLSKESDKPDEIFKRADDALYLAKAGGRNKVVLA